MEMKIEKKSSKFQYSLHQLISFVFVIAIYSWAIVEVFILRDSHERQVHWKLAMILLVTSAVMAFVLGLLVMTFKIVATLHRLIESTDSEE